MLGLARLWIGEKERVYETAVRCYLHVAIYERLYNFESKYRQTMGMSICRGNLCSQSSIHKFHLRMVFIMSFSTLEAFLLDTVRDAVHDWLNNEVCDASNRVYEEYLSRCVASLYAACSDSQDANAKIVNALRVHWDLNEEEAIDCLRYEKTVGKSNRNLERYLLLEVGLKWDEACEIALCSHKIFDEDSSLSTLSAEELYRCIQERACYED